VAESHIRRQDRGRTVAPAQAGTGNTPLSSLPSFLSVEEAAELLRTSRAAIYARISRGQMPGVYRDGRRVLISSADLIESLRRAPSPPEEMG
jgi:excisionase family DNA binding protein